MNQRESITDITRRVPLNGPEHYAPKPATPVIPPQTELSRDESQTLRDLYYAIATDPLIHIAELMYRLTYRDMMQMATLMVKMKPSEPVKPEDMASWLYDWAVEQRKVDHGD